MKSTQNNLKEIQVDRSRKIGLGNPIFIIAEAGVNHNGDLGNAKKLVDAAKKCGADAVKFQTFKASDLVTKGANRAKYQRKNTGSDESQFKMLKKLELDYNDFKELKAYCCPLPTRRKLQTF